MSGIDYDEVFAPTPRFPSICIMLALICEFDLDARQVDVKGAFLQAELRERIYMRQPEGYVDPDFPHSVCLLLKSLYGLKQAARELWKVLRSWLESLGFSSLNAECSVYILIIDGKISL